MVWGGFGRLAAPLDPLAREGKGEGFQKTHTPDDPKGSANKDKNKNAGRLTKRKTTFNIASQLQREGRGTG